MAVAYPIPDWLRPPPDPGREYTQAFAAGAQIAQEKARLAQSAQEAAMQAQIRQQQLAQESRENAQRIEVESAYRSQQIGLRKQALDQAQQKIEAQAASAARRFAAQEAIKADIAAGVPHAAAFLKHPDAYSSAAGMAGFAREERERIAPPKNIMPTMWTNPVTKEQIPINPQTGARITESANREPSVSVPITDNSFGPRLTGKLSNPAVQRALGTNAPALMGKKQQTFKDKSGKTWIYLGSNSDPSQDRDPANWQEAK